MMAARSGLAANRGLGRAGPGRLVPLTDRDDGLGFTAGPTFRNSSGRTSKMQMKGSSEDMKIRAGNRWLSTLPT